ncbi:MAG TPA: zinc-dependent metalloprotease [Aridibacter sp.]|nr:zinc-dependent metalloprotease [Aridibacter sp.]
MKRITLLFVCLLALMTLAFAQDKSAEKKTVEDLTEDLRKIDGFVPLWYDENTGKMMMEVSRLGQEFLYQISLATGVGSNPIGLDRGQLGQTRVVYFERAGNKILLVQPNYDFRALSDNPAEKRAVEESFAKSVIWGFKIAGESAGKIVVDATDFFVRDAHGVADRLRQTNQGSYSLDDSRSAFYMPRTKGFPKNSEVEVTLTLTTKGDPGRLIRQSAPSGEAVTVRERHSLVELPNDGYAPREFDPRVSAIPISFYDYATDISENLEKRWIRRHRLFPKDISADTSEPIEPIVYYVDNGAPKVIRDALIEGAQWWNQAFEAAGYRNAFKVKVLPEDADPQDVRYNVINWVHRSTRGWAYGSSVVDPRTGEIIKGVVTLDSQRARQDFLIASGLAPQYATDPNSACDFALLPDVDYLLGAQSKTDAAALAAARIRQLSAHEVGHTLGFAHNFAASTYGRASVMDYPAPMIKIVNRELDFSEAYDTGIGEFDKFSVKFAYSQFDEGTDEPAELEGIVNDGIANGMLFISDSDTRPASAAHPLANLWDNGPDPIANLSHEMNVRKIGLSKIGLANLEEGEPVANLELKLLPLYLHHRYQLTAATKSLGGVYYTYAVRKGASAEPSRVYEIVPADRQRLALAEALKTISTEELALPENILRLLPPTPYGFYSGRSENFPKRTSPIFDSIGAAEIAADFTLSGLLQPNRAARLVEFNARDGGYPGFREVVNSIVAATWRKPYSANRYHAAVERAVQSVTVMKLMELAGNTSARYEVRAISTDALRDLLANLKARTANAENGAHYRMTIDDITRFLERPDTPRKGTNPLPEPPGDPIGN